MLLATIIFLGLIIFLLSAAILADLFNEVREKIKERKRKEKEKEFEYKHHDYKA